MRREKDLWKWFPAYFDREDGPARFFPLLKKPAKEVRIPLSAATSDSNLLQMPISPSQLELLKNTPVESFHWSARATHALESARCKNLGDVFSITKEGWSERRHGGKKTLTEMANRIQRFLKIKRILRPPCDTTAIERNFRTNQIHAALTEAFALGGLTTNEIQVLGLRYGLSGNPPLLLRECGKIMHRTRQRMQQLEIAGMGRLSRHPDIRRALQSGLQAIQGRLWRKLAGKNNLLISKEIAMQELYKRVGGPESLLVKVCHGNMRKWLNKNLTPTSKGWLTPDLNGN
jgi:hypothetical protein